MIRLFREKIDPFDAEYDRRFGEPATEVLGIEDALDFLDDVIAFAEEYQNIQESMNDKYDLNVKRVVMTTLFEKAVKLLTKKHDAAVLKELKDIVIKLGKMQVESDKKNHRLTNAEGHFDLHLDGGRLILLYKYFDDDTVGVDIDKQSFQAVSLRMQDVVDHKELRRYNNNYITA